MVLVLALSLLLAAPLHAQPRAPDPVQAGADIAAFRDIAASTLPSSERFDAWAGFVVAFPRSPLAEVALATCLELGGDIAALLARLDPLESAFLVAAYRAHHEILLANPPESAAVTDAAPEADATTRAARTAHHPANRPAHR